MAGLGSFMQGLQGGIAFGQDVRANRQRERYLDSAQRQMDNAEAQQAEGWAKIGGDPGELADTALPDPFLYKVQQFFSGKRKKPRAAAIPTGETQMPGAGESQAPQIEGNSGVLAGLSADEVPQYADGGGPLPFDELMGEKPKALPPQTGYTRGTEDLVRAQDADNRRALTHTAPKTMRETAMQDLQAQSMRGQLDRARARGTPSEVRPAIPRMAAVPGEATQPPATPQTSGAAPVRAAGKTRPATAIPAKDPGGIDFKDVAPQDVPDFKTEDWASFRAQAMRDLIRGKGMSYSEAFDRVDQQVASMQQRGFTRYAQQGMAMQEAGNLKGAMAAYRAAFQYFPSGTDVKFGLHQGRIVGYGVDEQTGEPVGNPMLLDTERVAALVDNFQKPGAWLTWAKDRRDSQMKLKQMEEIDKPLAQSQIDVGTTNAQTNRMNAMNAAQENEWRYGPGSGGVGADGANYRFALTQFKKRLEEMEFNDPAQADQLAAIMAQLYLKNPNADPLTIIQKVMAAANQPEQ